MRWRVWLPAAPSGGPTRLGRPLPPELPVRPWPARPPASHLDHGRGPQGGGV